MKHLKDSRMMTTHKTTIQLIKEEKINMVKPKDKPHSQIDYLVINEKNEFNKIYNSISEFENIIVDKPFSNIKWLKLNPKNPSAFNELRQLQGNYEAIVFFILQHFIAITKKKIQSEQDKQILHTKIIELLQERTSYEMMPQDIEVIDFLISRSDELKKLPFSQAKKINVNVNLVNDFKDKLDKYQKVLVNFKKEFLS